MYQSFLVTFSLYLDKGSKSLPNRNVLLLFLNTEDHHSKPNSLAVMIVVQHMISAVQCAVKDFEQKL
jgi:hypothetical protein